MTLTRRSVLASTVAAATPHAPAKAQRPVIRIGVLNDMSGVYRDASGPTSAACARQAVDEFRAAHGGFDIEVLAADHQNRPDVGSNIARQWIDRDGVDMIVDVGNSAVALAVNGVCRDKDKAYVNSTAGSLELTGSQCSPVLVHWTYDNYMLSRSTGGALVGAGADSSPLIMSLAIRWSAKPRSSSARLAARCSAASDTRSRPAVTSRPSSCKPRAAAPR